MLRLFFRIDPDKLEDEDWADLSGQMWWALKTTGQVEHKDGKYRFIR